MWMKITGMIETQTSQDHQEAFGYDVANLMKHLNQTGGECTTEALKATLWVELCVSAESELSGISVALLSVTSQLYQHAALYLFSPSTGVRRHISTDNCSTCRRNACFRG
ncbi:hypothetical protein MHYP_G00004260 [Metynnis hypsauchen]